MCKECFYRLFEEEIHHTIINNKLFTKGDTVAIGASGGKGETLKKITDFNILLWKIFALKFFDGEKVHQEML